MALCIHGFVTSFLNLRSFVTLFHLHQPLKRRTIVSLNKNQWRRSSVNYPYCSVTQLCLTLQPHGLQHSRLSCLWPLPRVCSNSCPLSWWFHRAISSSVLAFSFCPQSLPASGSFPMRQLLTWGGQSIGVSALASSFKWTPRTDLLQNGPLDLLAVQGTLKSLLQHHSSKASILQCSAFFTVQLSHPYMTIGKTIALTKWTFVGKVMSLL